MNSNDLAQQLHQYIQELVKIQHLILKQEDIRAQHIVTLREKIALKVCQFKMAIQKLNIRQHHPSVINQMTAFFKNSFTLIIKETHRLIQIKPGRENHDKIKQKISVIKQIEQEMDSIWFDKKEKKTDGVMKKLNQNISMLSEKLNYAQLKTIAKDYLHKEFLAIRMIAYKLYEQYVAHSHSKIKQQLQEIKQSQLELQMQAEQLKEFNKQLKSQQKRLMRELNELKKVNDMIGKRYFVNEDKISQKKY